jgi:DNA-directed RNA polymerase beta subunit
MTAPDVKGDASIKVNIPEVKLRLPSNEQVLKAVTLPPPFEKKTTDNFDLAQPGGGYFSYDDSGKLLINYIELNGYSRFLIDAYNEWIKPGGLMDRQICDQEVIVGTDQKSRIRFRNIEKRLPRYSDNGDRNLTPIYAMISRRSYISVIIAEIYLERFDGKEWRPDVTIEPKPINICSTLPTMLGSELCYLNINKVSPQERFKSYSVPPSDPLGYFIIEGTERTIIGQDSQRLNKIIMTGEQTAPIARLQNSRYNGVTTITLVSTVKDAKDIMPVEKSQSGLMLLPGEYVLTLKDLREGKSKIATDSTETKSATKKGPRINMFVFFKLLFWLYSETFTSVKIDLSDSKGSEDSFEVIKKKFLLPLLPTGTPGKKSAAIKIMQELSITIASYTIYKHRDNVFFIDTISTSLLGMPSATTQIERIRRLKELVETTLMPRFPTPINKIQALALMMIKTASCKVGANFKDNFDYVQLDQRDSISVKQFRFAASMMSQLFNECLSECIKDATKAVKGNESPLLSFLAGYNNARDSKFTEVWRNSFVTEWGLKRKKKNIVQILRRESPIGTIDQLHTIDAAGLDRNSKEEKMRQVQGTQYELICPASTSDGDKCGIIKKKALTAIVTYRGDTSLSPLQSCGSKLVQPTWTNLIVKVLQDNNILGRGSTLFLINSQPIGWCNGESAREFCISQRRNGKFPMTCEIILEYTTNVLYFQLDENILVRPLLILDSDGQLLVDKFGLRGKSFDECLKAGAIEYIGAWEEEWNVKRVSRYEDVVDQFERRKKSAEYYRKKEQELTFNKMLLDTLITELKLQDLFTGGSSGGPLLVGGSSGGPLLVGGSSGGSKKMEEKIEELQKQQPNMNNEWNQFKMLLNTVKQLNADTDLAKIEYQRQTAIKIPTHCSLHPSALFSISAALIPGVGHNPAPRNTYQANMFKAGMGAGLLNQSLRVGDSSIKTLAYPNNPLWQSNLAESVGLDENPHGVTVTVAIMSWHGWGKEDAFVFRKGAVDAGMFHMWKEVEYRVTAKIAGQNQESFRRPPISSHLDPKVYQHIDENGLPAIHARLSPGDIVVGKVLKKGGTENDVSERVRIGEEGIVTDIIKTTNEATQETTVVVKLRNYRQPQRADKYAPRSAQKATVGIIIPDEDMPFDPITGQKPDVIVNPLAIVGRMTISYVYEIITGLIASKTGMTMDASAFQKIDTDALIKQLRDLGFSSSGKRELIDGQTGKPFLVQMLMGPCYFQGLRHHVKDKWQVRGRGRVKTQDRQPPGGKQSKGGVKSGEMERDSLIAHGMANQLQDRLCFSSDQHKIVMCRKCAIPAVGTATGSFNPCKMCGESNFGVLNIKYAGYAFQSFLAAAGIRWKLNLATNDEYKQQRDKIDNTIRNIGDLSITESMYTEGDDEDEDEEGAEGQEQEQEEGYDLGASNDGDD